MKPLKPLTEYQRISENHDKLLRLWQNHQQEVEGLLARKGWVRTPWEPDRAYPEPSHDVAEKFDVFYQFSDESKLEESLRLLQFTTDAEAEEDHYWVECKKRADAAVLARKQELAACFERLPGSVQAGLRKMQSEVGFTEKQVHQIAEEILNNQQAEGKR